MDDETPRDAAGREAMRAFFTEPKSEAPGRPGAEPRWSPGSKSGIGTALGGTGLVWFTLGRGSLEEVFYPSADNACTAAIGLLVADGRDFFSDERAHCDHRVELPHDGVPIYRLANTCRRGRYRIEKTILAHRDQDALLQCTEFIPLEGTLADYRVYALVDPMLGLRDAFEPDDAWLGEHRGVPMLFARGGRYCLAVAASPGWIGGSAGYFGTSDGRRDVAEHKRLTKVYGRADAGNVCLTGEVDPLACGGRFVLSLGLGPDPVAAGHHALAALLDDPEAVRAAYVRGWDAWQRSIDPPTAPAGGRDLARVSAFVLSSHETRTVPGAFVASLSTPWGEAQGPHQFLAQGGYHLVWPRDLVESAGGLLAAGAGIEATRALGYLRATQMADGHWPQNMWVTGAAYWDGIQLGETALPILLVDLLRRRGALSEREVVRFWPMVRRAAGYLVRSGPATQEDRWENQRGYTPFTLGSTIAALLVAADLADESGESDLATYLRDTADAWHAAIESWLYVTDTELARSLGIEGYYLRIVPPELDELSTPKDGKLTLRDDPPGTEGVPTSKVVSADALCLVRFGLRRADDPRIINTRTAIDATLRVETPHGPSWRRYTADGYGEHADGSPFTHRDGGTFGRAWPLLTGERAHYELMAGRRDEAERLARAMADFASDAGMIPEQVWDADDIPEKGLYRGRATGSASPLAWAHAEYLKLLRSLAEGTPFDLPPQTVRRYVDAETRSNRVIWRPDHPRRRIAPGEILRVVTPGPATIRWSYDRSRMSTEVQARDSTVGPYYADLDTERLDDGTLIKLEIHGRESRQPSEELFSIKVSQAPLFSHKPLVG